MLTRRLRSPVRVDIVLNGDCNHKCVHCYNPWRENISSCDFLKENDFKTKFDFIVSELKKANVWSVILTGGEPLLHLDNLLYAIDSLNKNNISMCLNTNLTKMTDELAKSLRFNHGWDNMVLASLPSIHEELCDEITAVKGSYKAILKGIRNCTKNGIRVGLNTVITRKNIDDLSSYTQFIKDHCVDYLSISTVIPPVYDASNMNYYLTDQNIREIADALLRIKEECDIDIGSVTPLPLCILRDANKYTPVLNTTCLAGVSKCSIHVVDGRVTACAHEDCSYGNIYSDGLQACWNQMAGWGDGIFLNPECKKCKWLYFCGGECRMMRRSCYLAPLYHLDADADICFDPEHAVCENQIFDSHDKFRICPELRCRKEDYGYLLKAGFIETYISETLYDICVHLEHMSTFSYDDIWTILEKTNESQTIIKMLVNRMIIEKVTS